MAIPFLELTLGFIIAVYVFDTYIDIRQHRRFNLPKPKQCAPVLQPIRWFAEWFSAPA